MRALLIGVLAVSVAGCTFGVKTCSDTSECGTGATCQQGFCVATIDETGGGDGQTGGGSAQGGGVGTVGGGAQGGGTTTTGGGGGANVCDGGCAEWQECTVDAVCVDMDLELSWATPDAGARFGPDQTVPLRLIVTRPDGGALPGSIPFALVGTTTSSLAGPAFTGSVGLSNASGTKTLWAGWDGGPTASETFDIDSTPPTLSIALPAGYHQRDEIIYGIFRADDALADAGVLLGNVPMSLVASTQCSGFGTSQLDKACFALDLSKPDFLMMDGGLGIALSATDAYGNSTSQDGGSTLVTRLRWMSQIAATSTSVQALVVGSDGAIYAGTAAAGSDSTLMKLNAATGGVVVDSGIGDVQSLAIDDTSGVDIVYAAFNDASDVGNIGAVSSSSFRYGGSDPRAPCQGAGASRTYSGIALYNPDAGTTVYAVGSVNSVSTTSNDGVGCLYRPNAGYLQFQTSGNLDAFNWSSNGLSAPVNVVVNGHIASFLADNSVALGLTNACVWYGIDLRSSASTPAKSQLTTARACVGQAGTGIGFLATSKTNGAFGDEVFAVSPDAGVNGGTFNGTQVDRGVPSLASPTQGFCGQGNSLVMFNPSNVDAGATQILGGAGTIRSAPVLGAPRSAGGVSTGYAVSSEGRVFAFDYVNNVALWSSTVTAAGESSLGHPAFDANRANCASNTGILYFGTAKGRVYAVIVDSPQLLDTPGAWPKYQRTMGNAGNTDPFFPTNWPAACP